MDHTVFALVALTSLLTFGAGFGLGWACCLRVAKALALAALTRDDTVVDQHELVTTAASEAPR